MILGLEEQDQAHLYSFHLVSLVARSCLIAADTIVLYVTWRATSHKLPRIMRNSVCGIVNKKNTFSNILLRDGEDACSALFADG